MSSATRSAAFAGSRKRSAPAWRLRQGTRDVSRSAAARPGPEGAPGAQRWPCSASSRASPSAWDIGVHSDRVGRADPSAVRKNSAAAGACARNRCSLSARRSQSFCCEDRALDLNRIANDGDRLAAVSGKMDASARQGSICHAPFKQDGRAATTVSSVTIGLPDCIHTAEILDFPLPLGPSRSAAYPSRTSAAA